MVSKSFKTMGIILTIFYESEDEIFIDRFLLIEDDQVMVEHVEQSRWTKWKNERYRNCK